MAAHVHPDANLNRGLLRVAEKSNDPRWLFSITVNFEDDFIIQMVNA